MDSESAVAGFENDCKNAVALQHELLNQILLRNTSCEYLQRFGAPLDLSSFKSQVPVVSYDQIWPDIKRIADGSTDPILCTEPITHFAHSSGTTSGKHKIIPQINFSLLETKSYQASTAYLNRCFPVESSDPVSMSFLYCGEQHRTNSGLLVGSASTNLYKGEYLKQTPLAYTSPYELVVSASDWRQTTYCHLLCGLLQRHKVEIIHALFAYMLVEAMRVLQKEWQSLCEDISTGTLNTKITDEKLRQAMSEVLQQRNSTELAEEIAGICSKAESESWYGVIPKLWPRVKYAESIMTGAMQPYVPALRRFAGDLPLTGYLYASSEGSIMGVITNPSAPPEELLYTLTPYSVFFEFIPVDGDEESIVGFEGVETGKQYELVITNSRGLYRYKLGDVIKFVNFLHEAPQVEFSYRKSAVLSLTSEKVDEQELQKAVLRSCPGSLEVENFTSYADFGSGEPPHYVIFCELRDAEGYSKQELLREFCEKLDKSFDNVRYLMGRVNKTIGPLELVMVEQGTFEKLMERSVRSGTAPGQYKTPRCVTTPDMLELLKLGRVASFRSSVEVPASLVKAWEPSFPDN